MEPEREIVNVEDGEELSDRDDTDVGCRQYRLQPMEHLRKHILIVKWLGVLIILCTCLTAFGIVGRVTAKPCSVSEPECDPIQPKVYIDFMHDYAIDGTRYLNLTACIFIHRWRFASYGSNFTVCQPDTGPAILDINLNGSLPLFADTEQWKALKFMIPQIDASIEKASLYLANYVPDISGK
jgi:hypothetical protein